MDIARMHVWFRQYAQQMGMQNVRAILPEQIDICINTVISDTVNELISNHINNTNDRVLTDNSKLGQVNALRSLYKVKYNWMFKSNNAQLIKNDIISINTDDGDYYNLQFDIDDFIPKRVNENDEPFDDNHDTSITNDCLHLVDVSLNYTKFDGRVSNWYPVRLIDDIFLADTLNDFILKPRYRSPIAVVNNNKVHIYIGDSYIDENDTPQLKYHLRANYIRVGYIGRPATVRKIDDLVDASKNINCDLPEFMHVDIVKKAVDLFRLSTSGALYAAQQQAVNQQRENARNGVPNNGINQR